MTLIRQLEIQKVPKFIQNNAIGGGGGCWVRSGCFQNGLPECSRNSDGYEQALEIEVIFAGFIDHTDVAVLECVRIIRDRHIDLSLFKRSLSTLILNANEKL